MHKLSGEHETLIGASLFLALISLDVILEEEDDLIESHKQHIDDVMDLVKQVQIEIC